MHGVLNLDKPCGISSQEAVTRVKRVLRVKKAGHAGTLDPMATGVLLVYEDKQVPHGPAKRICLYDEVW
jgi:tRNA pseudouridine(55) synthase